MALVNVARVVGLHAPWLGRAPCADPRTLQDQPFTSLRTVQEQCIRQRSKCSFVYDPACDSQGIFYLCKPGHSILRETHYSDCMY